MWMQVAVVILKVILHRFARFVDYEFGCKVIDKFAGFVVVFLKYLYLYAELLHSCVDCKFPYLYS